MRNIAACAALGIALIARTVGAATCYSPAEIEADQALRFRAELEIIGETCKDPSYGNFLAHNRELLASYRRALLGHFRREDLATADTKLDQYLTWLANEASWRTGLSSSFCADASDRVAIARSMQAEDLRVYARAQATTAEHQYMVCSTPAGSGATFVTRSLDTEERRDLQRTLRHLLETAPAGREVTWRSSSTDNEAMMVAKDALRTAGGQWCREFDLSLTVDGEQRQGHGAACRLASGWWDLEP